MSKVPSGTEVSTLAGEGGHRHYWPTRMGVNLANGNLNIAVGAGTCVTCGGGGSGPVYPSPQDTQLHGPVFVYNTMGTADTDLGSKWMLPYHTYLTVSSGNVTLIDADGTMRYFVPDVVDTPQGYISNTENCTLVKSGSEYILTRYNGDAWIYDTTELNLLRIESRTGHTITIARDGNQRITSVTDGQGRVTTYHYQTFGGQTRLVEIREPAPGDKGWYSTFLDYDSSKRLSLITNAMGEPTRFEYDGSNRISKAIDGHGHDTEYTYDGSSRVTNIEDAANNDTVIAYATGPITATVTDRLSHNTVYTFDSDGRVIKIKDAEDNESEFAYNSTTWELSEVLGPKIPKSGTPWTRHKTVFTWGSTVETQHDLLSKEIYKKPNTGSDTLLQTESWEYTAEHDVELYTDPMAEEWASEYEGTTGLVKKKFTPESGAQAVVENTYDSGNLYRMTATKNGVNQTTSFAYNQNTANSYGTPDKITPPSGSGSAVNLKVDIRGRVYEQTGPSGNADKFQFDALDRLVRHLNPDGTSTESLYDCCHLVATLDENQVGTKMTYDVMGNLASTTDANGEETTNVYNAEGWRISTTDPRGKTTSWSYDYIGRVLQVDYPGGWQEIMTYFEPGMLKTLRTKKSSDEDTITFVYDDLYRLIKKDLSSGTDTEFEYDANGNRTTMKDASGEKRYTWDAANRLEKVVQGPTAFTTNENFQIEYVWNDASQCTRKKVTVRTLSAQQWDYAFTVDGYLDTVTNPDSEVTDHDYLTDGRLKKITLRSTAGSNKPTREFFYQDTDSSHAYVSGKNKHLRKTLDKKQAGTVICSSEYDLDAAGMRLGRADHDGKYDAWAYDPNYQLRAESRWSAKTPGTQTYRKEYDYDGNGNRLGVYDDGTKTAYTNGDNNQLTAAGSESFLYDFFGNMVNIGDGVASQDFEYNWERNMTQTYFDEASADSHEYDGDGRRMRSKLNAAANWTNFVHDELTEQVLGEYTLISSTFTLKAANTYGWGLISSNREGTKRYFHFDGLGNTMALTDSSEVVQDTYVWTAFGLLSSSTGSSVNPYRYVGQWGYYDDGAVGSPHGFLLLGVRYYAPEYGRFLTWDPIGARGYGYCGNAVTMAIDPGGLQPNQVDCSLRRGDCITAANSDKSDCITNAGIILTSCLLLCTSSGPYLWLCRAGCAGLYLLLRGKCSNDYQDAIKRCQWEYEACMHVTVANFQDLCWAPCLFRCIARGEKTAKECGDDCRSECLKLERRGNRGIQ